MDQDLQEWMPETLPEAQAEVRRLRIEVRRIQAELEQPKSWARLPAATRRAVEIAKAALIWRPLRQP